MIINNVIQVKATDHQGKALLSKAIEEIKTQPLDPLACRIYDTPTDIAMAPYIRINNLRSLVLRKEHDGWYGDIYLKKVRKGLPNIIGTPLNKPHASKRGAYSEACEMILEIYQAEQSGCAPRLLSKYGPEVGQPTMIGGQTFCTAY
ncbi:MAG: hypothetical protein ACKVLA_06520 [Rhodobacterales bacterium]